jgi:hypothetical protein
LISTAILIDQAGRCDSFDPDDDDDGDFLLRALIDFPCFFSRSELVGPSFPEPAASVVSVEGTVGGVWLLVGSSRLLPPNFFISLPGKF